MLAAEHATDVVQSESERPRRGGSLAPVAPAAQTLELERQLHALRVELRSEVVARDKIEMHARELAARLTSMTTQMSSMRARASDETGARRRSSIIPAAASDARTRLSMRAPGLFAEIDELKATIARLTAENDSLRRAAAAAAAAPPARSANARTDLVEPEVLEELVRRIIRLDNVRAAAVADTGGLVLAGSGELANALAAFGASMKDAATRSERLLPLKLTEEVTVRDTQGFVFSTQVLGPPEAELALVTLAQGDVPVHEMREIVAQTPGLGGGALPAR
jgi:predicted regulator of Ras-like GTPase activity (Roadblock/LC7/MglB family)